ncbi:hypothetical protein D9M68_994830 [compost metagenome]
MVSQLIGTALGVLIAFAGGVLVYGLVKALVGIRLSQEQEYYGADLSIHKIGALNQE